MEIRLLTEHDVDEFVRLRQEARAREPSPLDARRKTRHMASKVSRSRLHTEVPEGNFLVGAFNGVHGSVVQAQLHAL